MVRSITNQTGFHTPCREWLRSINSIWFGASERAKHCFNVQKICSNHINQFDSSKIVLLSDFCYKKNLIHFRNCCVHTHIIQSAIWTISYLLSPFPWASELWPPASLQSTWSHSRDSSSSWLGSQHWHQRIPATPRIISARADSTEIGHQEHDVCCTSLSWSLPDSVCHVLWHTWVPMKLKNRCSIRRTETHLSCGVDFPTTSNFSVCDIQCEGLKLLSIFIRD
jgi:hypothetical protein